MLSALLCALAAASGYGPHATPRPTATITDALAQIRPTFAGHETNGFIATDGGGGQRKLRGGGEGASRTAHDSEQPVGCVVDGEGEWCRGSAPQERWGHATCSLPQPSNAMCV